MIRRSSKQHRLSLVYADAKGRIYDEPMFLPSAMKAQHIYALNLKNCVKLPGSSELFMLPARRPIGIDPESGKTVVLKDRFAVAAFIPPGYTLTFNPAYTQDADAPMLPLFAYGACFYFRGDFYVTAISVDRRNRHNEKFIDIGQVKEGVRRYHQLFPSNRLVPHLEHCALVSGCANAKNFFLGRMECPIPSSPACNAQCQGCISFQPEKEEIESNQDRIRFVPTADEIAELTTHHFNIEKDPIVSFGQGCEGEPTLQKKTLEEAILKIRLKTAKGVINLNTNASDPQAIERLFAAGLGSMRVSLNSVRKRYYEAYYQPKNYQFEDVMTSIGVAKRQGGFVSINYLCMSGFTDTLEEYQALRKFIKESRIDMIQWRNLNYDPLVYHQRIGNQPLREELLGMDVVIKKIHHEFKHLKRGYFNMTQKQLEALKR